MKSDKDKDLHYRQDYLGIVPRDSIEFDIVIEESQKLMDGTSNRAKEV